MILCISQKFYYHFRRLLYSVDIIQREALFPFENNINDTAISRQHHELFKILITAAVNSHSISIQRNAQKCPPQSNANHIGNYPIQWIIALSMKPLTLWSNLNKAQQWKRHLLCESISWTAALTWTITRKCHKLSKQASVNVAPCRK